MSGSRTAPSYIERTGCKERKCYGKKVRGINIKLSVISDVWIEKSHKYNQRAGNARRAEAGRSNWLPRLRLHLWLTIADSSFFDARANMTQIQKITGYTKAMDSMTDEKAEKQKAAAETYNEKIRKEQDEQIFRYRGEAATDEDYEQQLSEDEGGVMGYLRSRS